MAEARRANAKPVSGTSSDATSALPPDHDERCQIVEQLDTTTVVPPGARFAVDEYLNLVISV